MDFNTEYEIMKCLKALMNNQYGLNETLVHAPKSVEIIAECMITSPHFFVRKLAAELLTVLCYTDGHEQVQVAFESIYRNAHFPFSLHRQWMVTLEQVMASKERVGGGSSGGLVAGVGWVGDNRVTEKDILDYLVSMVEMNHIDLRL